MINTLSMLLKTENSSDCGRRCEHLAGPLKALFWIAISIALSLAIAQLH